MWTLRPCSCRAVPSNSRDDAQDEHHSCEQSAIAEDLEEPRSVGHRRPRVLSHEEKAGDEQQPDTDSGEQRSVDQRPQDAATIFIDDSSQAKVPTSRKG